MNEEPPETLAGGEVAVYEDAGGEVQVDVRLDRETVWLTQRQMAEVFDSTPENVLMHLRNIFASGELEAEATTKEFLAVRTEGRRTVRRRPRADTRRNGSQRSRFATIGRMEVFGCGR